MVYIILVNWNGWRDTLECLESLFKLDETGFTVVLYDNYSKDGSIEKIKSWANGTLAAEIADSRYWHRIQPPLRKSVRHADWKPGESAKNVAGSRLVLIAGDRNLGFAGGCNVCMRLALDCGDCEFVWLLNNDTFVPSDALTHLIAKMRRTPSIGMCGSTLRYYSEPEVVQCYGGYGFNEWIGRVLPIAGKNIAGNLPQEEDIEAYLKYISGASILVRRDLLETVGLLNEQYFLYFEEIDWATRARGLYSLGYCRESVVYHKEGRAIGSDRSNKKRSLCSESFLSRNRVLFTRTYYPARTPVVMLWMTLVSLQRIFLGRYSSGRTMLAYAWKGLFQKPRRPSSRDQAPASSRAI